MKSLRIGVLLLALMLAAPLSANDLSNSTWSETDGSNNSASPNGWTTGTMLPSQVEPVARAMMGALKRWYNHANGTVTSGGAANVQTLTYAIAPAAYVTGDFYLFKAGFTNTTATTLNVNGLGAKTVQRAGAALVAGDILTGAYYGVVYDGTQFQIVFSSNNIVVAQLPVPAATTALPSNPSSTNSTTKVMMGLACAVTPSRSGKVLLMVSGDMQSSVAGDGVEYQIRYGTGAAPANGAALTGTGAGAAPVNIPAAGGAVPFTAQAVVTGLTVATAYWFDLGVAAFTGGFASVSNLTCTAFES